MVPAATQGLRVQLGKVTVHYEAGKVPGCTCPRTGTRLCSFVGEETAAQSASQTGGGEADLLSPRAFHPPCPQQL